MPIPPLFNSPPTRLTYPFLTTVAVAIVKGRIVCPGANDDTITGTTSADAVRISGIALDDVAAADAGGKKRVEVQLLQAGTIVPLVVGAAVTKDSQVVVADAVGRIKDAGATPDARTLIGRALAGSSTVGDFVPVLIGG